MAVRILSGLLVILLFLLPGCNRKLEQANGYVQAVLDKTYSGKVEDYVTYVESVDVKQASKEHLNDLNVEADFFLSMYGAGEVSESTRKLLCDFYQKLYEKSKYTVGKASEADETTFVIPVTVAPMDIFLTAGEDLQSYLDDFNTRNENGEFSEIDDVAFYDEYVKGLCNVLTRYLDKVGYLDEQTVDVHMVKGADGFWSIPDEDLEAVDLLIIAYSDQ